ncbi:purine and uridine phosphorylase [Aspergillus steynii IBT 23096]|uniref:Purine and uridine phosphorylase n=1 Tax=Aspergillus steynii IBT 23096 TaxID=1392250 RepID=A0A2I2GA05_9EURO|nr:purine and uridine phosphorylase [Aspergillus steynii IBT 23096]PLB49710.1 purine and uridine phosphorylase [Aspergillus steynii IBT 23096]
MRPTTREEFEVAIICALPHEADAVKASFDETYDTHSHYYSKRPGDINVYTNGRIEQHNVVLCHLPNMGKGSAAVVASNLRMSYPGVQLALVVGICGAVPVSKDGVKIALGDVIISDSLVEYDIGRQYPDGFQRKNDAKSMFGRPSLEIRTVLASLRTLDIGEQFQERIHYHFKALQARKPVWENPSTSLHHESLHEKEKDSQILQSGLHEDTPGPALHIGTMASADTVMKSDTHRDELAHSEGIIGFEMEGPGVWDIFPCLIIKGVCDYADSQKNKLFQNYAAATGAAGAKAFLSHWRSNIRKGM